MIRPCNDGDIRDIYEIINDAAKAYKGVIPDDQWHDPYMSSGYLTSEVEDGVVFQGFVDSDNNLLGVMGIQEKCDVFLIRHAYVRTLARRNGVGRHLLQHLCPNLVALVSTIFVLGALDLTVVGYHFGSMILFGIIPRNA